MNQDRKRGRPEPVQVIKQRRDAALKALVQGVPYIQFLGIEFDRRGDELTAQLPSDDKLIGNPLIPALHGGVTASFLEDMESGALDAGQPDSMQVPRLPKTSDFTVEYLRSGLPRDAYARARVNRSDRRCASVHVGARQDNRARLFAQATGHFPMPGRVGEGR